MVWIMGKSRSRTKCRRSIAHVLWQSVPENPGRPSLLREVSLPTSPMHPWVSRGRVLGKKRAHLGHMNVCVPHAFKLQEFFYLRLVCHAAPSMGGSIRALLKILPLPGERVLKKAANARFAAQ